MSSRTQQMYDVQEPWRLENPRERKVRLEVCGQGTLAVNFVGFSPPREGKVSLLKEGGQTVLEVRVSDRGVSLFGDCAWRFNCTALVDLSSMHLLYLENPCKYLWISINKHVPFIKFGHGYMLESNTLFRFEPKNLNDREIVESALHDVQKVKFSDEWKMKTALKYWRFPVMRDPSPLIAADDTISLAALADNPLTTAQWLPKEVVRLHSTVTSAKVALSEQVVAWINYSLNTKGCILQQKVKQKEKKSNVSYDKKSSFLRIGMGDDAINSPGQPFVLEIWPQHSQSPIHQHGDAAAVIKVLHGTIEVAFYNPLCEENNEDIKPIKTVVLNKGDITWMTPEFYQTHTVRNICKNSMTATIQCYNYMNHDVRHYEQFDYVSEVDWKMHNVRPRSDFEFDDMINTVKGEYMRGNDIKQTKKMSLMCVK